MKHGKPHLTSAPVVFNDRPSNSKPRFHIVSALDDASLFAGGGRRLITAVLESVQTS